MTLEPVPQKIDEEIERLFLPEGAAATLPEDIDLEHDDEPETYGDKLPLGPVALEALALALEPYPRAKASDEVKVTAAPPGVEPLTDEALKPFAALSALKAQLEGGEKDG